MRTIGMLGGMSWESSAEYYRLANERVRDRLGGRHSARLLVDSVDFAAIEELQVSGRWDDAGRFLAQRAVALESAGADLLVLCTGLPHHPDPHRGGGGRRARLTLRRSSSTRPRRQSSSGSA